MEVTLEHTFVGCNRNVHALDWGPGSLIAFTAHNAIVIADLKVSFGNSHVSTIPALS